MLGNYAWYKDNTPGFGEPGYGAQVVKTTPDTNQLGLYDMSGNVSEWCHDELAVSSERVFFGGGYSSYASSQKATRRVETDASDMYANIGFRVARSAN